MTENKKVRSKQLEAIKTHWKKAGVNFPIDSKITPTSRDPYLGMLEEKYILEFLPENCNAMEIGCGDGSHTLAYANKVKKLLGVDIADSLLDVAKTRMANTKFKNTDFICSSVLDFDQILKEEKFDCVISQRCLINLPDWDTQKRAIEKIADKIKSGGLLLFSEGFIDELEELNKARNAVGLESISVAQYNHNFSRYSFEEFIKNEFDIVATRHYGGYLFFSRVLHPLAVLPESPRHDSPINRAAYETATAIDLPDTERFSYNRFYVLKKK